MGCVSQAGFAGQLAPSGGWLSGCLCRWTLGVSAVMCKGEDGSRMHGEQRWIDPLRDTAAHFGVLKLDSP